MAPQPTLGSRSLVFAMRRIRVLRHHKQEVVSESSEKNRLQMLSGQMQIPRNISQLDDEGLHLLSKQTH